MQRKIVFIIIFSVFVYSDSVCTNTRIQTHTPLTSSYCHYKMAIFIMVEALRSSGLEIVFHDQLERLADFHLKKMLSLPLFQPAFLLLAYTQTHTCFEGLASSVSVLMTEAAKGAW